MEPTKSITGDGGCTQANHSLPDIPILYQDQNVIVINKPAGVLTHATVEHPEAPSIASYFAAQLDDSDALRPGIVHRLDKDTSGVMILAKNTASKEFLQAQFKARNVQKTYLALVWGHLQHAQARIELPIARSLHKGNQMRVVHGGKMAVSQYHVEQVFERFSLLKIDLQTGRTHQIRVHFAHIGHPVVGDRQYGTKPMPAGLSRQFLHAMSLGCELPGGERKQFEAPVPADLENFLQSL